MDNNFDPTLHPYLYLIYKSNGFLDKDIAPMLGISPNTLVSWKQEHDGFDIDETMREKVLEGKIEEYAIRTIKGYYVDEVSTVKDGEGKVIKTITNKKFVKPDGAILKKILESKVKGYGKKTTLEIGESFDKMAGVYSDIEEDENDKKNEED